MHQISKGQTHPYTIVLSSAFLVSVIEKSKNNVNKRVVKLTDVDRTSWSEFIRRDIMLEVSSPSTNRRAFADPRKAKKEVQSLGMRSSELSDTRALNDPSRSKYDCEVIASTPNEAAPDTTSR